MSRTIKDRKETREYNRRLREERMSGKESKWRDNNQLYKEHGRSKSL